MTKQVILTGLRANNDLHIGNYFGAMLPTIDMATRRSDEFQVNLFIPDLHSFTTPIDHSKLYEQTLQNARIYMASGLAVDRPNVHMYRQSYISAHSELTWILDCFTGMGEMSRMTQYKDKSGKLNAAHVSVGLFNYPVLMAADILLYGATYVPVGDDQSQHLEFARDIAERMNSRFGELFVVPEPVTKQHQFFGKDQGLRIMNLQDPTKKMSKSDKTGKGVIFLGDSPEIAAKKIMGATTDDKGHVAFDRANQPGISNLLEILSLIRRQPIAQTVDEFAGIKRYGDFKHVVAEAVAGELTAFHAALDAVDTKDVLDHLVASEVAMREQAHATLQRVQQAIGLRTPAEQ